MGSDWIKSDPFDTKVNDDDGAMFIEIIKHMNIPSLVLIPSRIQLVKKVYIGPILQDFYS